MIDIKLIRENKELVKENIKKKFQDHKLPLVDEVIVLDAEARKTQQEADNLRAERNKISKQIGALMAQGKKEEAENKKKEVQEINQKLADNEGKEEELKVQIKDSYQEEYKIKKQKSYDNVLSNELNDIPKEIKENGEYKSFTEFCERIAEEELFQLEAACKKVEEAIADKDLKKIAQADVAFHDIIVKATRNTRLVQMVNNLSEQMYRYRFEYQRIGCCSSQ